MAKRGRPKVAISGDTPVAVMERPKGRVPGQTITDDKGRKQGKVPWTMKAIENIFGLCEYTPDETCPVTWNGVSIQCIRGVSQLMPTCFRDILLDRKRRMGQVKTISTQYGDIERGALGPLPPNL